MTNEPDITHVVLTQEVMDNLNISKMNYEETSREYGISEKWFYAWQKNLKSGSDYQTWLFVVSNPEILLNAAIKHGITFFKIYRNDNQ